jgi:hypothetical protein
MKTSFHAWIRYPAAVALACGLVLSGCAGSSRPSPAAGASTGASPGGAPSARPAPSSGDPGAPAADALVLRWTRTGGFAGTGGPGTVPEFSLYGDGRFVVPGQTEGAWPRLREYRLTPAGLDRVVAAARAAGLDRSRTLDRPDIADAFTLNITFVSGGRANRTTIVHPEGSDDPAVRFWRSLDPRSWPKGEFAGEPRDYEPARFAALARPDSTGGQAADWPLGRLSGDTDVGGRRCTVYSGDDVGTAREKAEDARPGALWRAGGATYRIDFRPMLPDERDCAALR